MSRARVVVLLVLFGPLVALLAADPAKAPPDLPDGTEAALKQIPQFKLPAGMKAELWACEPKLASPVAISVDEKGRVFVAEEYRLGKGAAENRGNPAFNFTFFLDDDLQIRTTADRLAVYKKHADKLPGQFGYFTANADQVRRLEDTTGSGRADKSTVFAGGFNDPLDGLCAGVLAVNGDVYVTCIPSLYKLKDTKGTGVADKKETLLTGFGPNIAFYGHDLHGLIMGPDGRLYFSVGDRGFNVLSKEGKQFEGPRHGAVFRCNPDGTEFEVVHRGLRNPQELAFDQFGNLFADDNNCDKGDHARLVYICDGGNSGWNMAYQTIPDPYLTGPWHAERLWHEPHQGQAAYIVPTVGAIGTGPSGFLFTSGTMLAKRYENSFIMCNYTGNGGLEAFKVKPKGAGFEIVDYHDFLKPIRATDAEFGPDGKLYVADFVDLNWDGRSAGGRIYTVFDPEKLRDPVIVETKKLFEEGFAHRKVEELVKLLGHPDMRVRQRAQFALVESGALAALTRAAEQGKPLERRLHALWGLWQVSRTQPKELQTVAGLLTDADPEMRAQAAKIVGDRKHAPAAAALVKLLADREPRVRFFAAEALGKLKHKPAVKSLIEVIRANADADPFLRHACVTALARIGDTRAVEMFRDDKSVSVQLAVVLVMRAWQDFELADFVKDDFDILVRTEAARAVNDVPLEKSQHRLARELDTLYEKPLADGDAFARRAINANFRLGAAENAKAVLGAVLNANASALVRSEALACLRDWAEPGNRDRVTGFWRPLPKRDAKIAKEVVQAGLNDLLTKTSGRLQIDAITLISKLGVAVDRDKFDKWATDTARDPQLRAALLRLLAAGPEKIKTATLMNTLADKSPVLRATARDVLADLNPPKAAEYLREVFDGDAAATVFEKQQAVATLARMKQAEAVAVLDGLAAKLADGTLLAELRLDAWDALKAAPNAKRDAARKKFEGAMKPDPVGKFQVSLTGGDKARGKDLFFSHAAAQCVRCHKAEGIGGTAGPDLSDVARRNPEKTREHLLESIVLPNAKIAKGYASVTLTLADGRVLAGVILDETKAAVTLQLPDGKTATVAVADIDKRTVPTSPMPSAEKVLTPREMRDLIEYLSGLK